MKHSDSLTPRQLTAAAFVAILSPLVRRYPRALAASAGRTAWLSPLLLFLPLAAGIAVLWLFYRKQPPGTGFADILCTALGKFPGRALTGLYGLWFALYAGFLLRSGADRFVSTVYPGAAPGLFVIITALLCTAAALGRTVSVARSAMLFRPLMAALFGIVFFLSWKDLDVSLLLPLRPEDVPANWFGALQLLNVLSAGAFLVFFTDRLSGPFRAQDWLGWAIAMPVLILLMTVSCLGVFGHALTAKLRYPFFMLVRDLSVLGALERAEPVVIALWVLSDFIMISLLLRCAANNLCFCFGGAEGQETNPLPVLLCAGLAAAGALAIPGDMAMFELLSETLVPLLHAAFSLVLPLPVLVIGLLRRKI